MDDRHDKEDIEEQTDSAHMELDFGDEDNHSTSDDGEAVLSESDKARMELYDWLQCIVFAIIVAIFIFVFIGRAIGVDGRSMMGTLHNRDRVVISNLFYTPKNGDIVVFNSPMGSQDGTPLVKRVIATAGQTIDINFDTGDVIVDGVIIHEPYINDITRSRHNFEGEITVPEGHIFVMGDNRNSSSDSRDNRVGTVDTRFILGKVLFVAIPGTDGIDPRDWSRVGIPR